MACQNINGDIAMQYINWKFLTPGGPHHGGNWKGLVKPFKIDLKAVLHDRSLPKAVLLTTLIKTEGILHSNI